MFEKCVLTILELNWNQCLGHKKRKWNICHHYANVVHPTAKQIIWRRRKNENVFKMSKAEKYTCKACKNPVFHCQICKFVGFLLPSSSWLLKLTTPNRKTYFMLSFTFVDNLIQFSFPGCFSCTFVCSTNAHAYTICWYVSCAYTSARTVWNTICLE